MDATSEGLSPNKTAYCIHPLRSLLKLVILCRFGHSYKAPFTRLLSLSQCPSSGESFSRYSWGGWKWSCLWVSKAGRKIFADVRQEDTGTCWLQDVSTTFTNRSRCWKQRLDHVLLAPTTLFVSSLRQPTNQPPAPAAMWGPDVAHQGQIIASCELDRFTEGQKPGALQQQRSGGTGRVIQKYVNMFDT